MASDRSGDASRQLKCRRRLIAVRDNVEPVISCPCFSFFFRAHGVRIGEVSTYSGGGREFGLLVSQVGALLLALRQEPA